jgi:hypothetical protein
MRILLLASSLSLIAAGGAALAQSGSRPLGATPPPTTPMPQAQDVRPKSDDADAATTLRTLSAQYLAECMRDWDAATHMTKQEWARTCRRVVDGRAKFKLEQGKLEQGK